MWGEILQLYSVETDRPTLTDTNDRLNDRQIPLIKACLQTKMLDSTLPFTLCRVFALFQRDKLILGVLDSLTERQMDWQISLLICPSVSQSVSQSLQIYQSVCLFITGCLAHLSVCFQSVVISVYQFVDQSACWTVQLTGWQMYHYITRLLDC